MIKKLFRYELTKGYQQDEWPLETRKIQVHLPVCSEVVSAVVHRHDTRIFLWCEVIKGDFFDPEVLHSFWIVPLGGVVPEGAKFLNYVDAQEGEAYAIYQAV
jgi:hypothetical protein